MDLFYSLIIYIIFLVLVFFIFYFCGCGFWKALVISLILSQALLWLLKSPYNINIKEEYGSIYGMYIFINIMTIVVVYLYVLFSFFEK